MLKTKKHLLKNLKNFRKNRDSNLNILIECIAIVMIWRGVWDFLDIYLFPDDPFMSNLISIALWIIILLVDDGKLWELEAEPHKTKNIK